MTTEPTPQELIEDMVEAATYTAMFHPGDQPPKRYWDARATIVQAFTALWEMHGAIVEWVRAEDNDRLGAATVRLEDIASTPPTGISLRAELAEARKENALLRQPIEMYDEEGNRIAADSWTPVESGRLEELEGAERSLTEAQAEVERLRVIEKAARNLLAYEQELGRNSIPQRQLSIALADAATPTEQAP